MTLHDFIPEYKEETGRNISGAAAYFLRAVDTALAEFKEFGIKDALNGCVAVPKDAFIHWAESHVNSIVPGLAEEIGAMAFDSYMEGYTMMV